MKVVIAMPAYNVEQTLEQTVRALPEKYRSHILLGNNRSEDGTEAVARRLGLTVMTHDRNYGYGGNLKGLFPPGRTGGAGAPLHGHPALSYPPSSVDLFGPGIARAQFCR